MTDAQPPPLDDRKAAVLRAIVERYVETAQPVGSQTVARAHGLGVSAATVRNDMGTLEREGYIVQPHTSAGRIPTDRGYRFYVDHFTHATDLAPAQRREVADFFTTATRVMEDLLHDTSQLLARLTHHASVVLGPQPDAAVVRSAQLVKLQPHVLLAVAVLSNGVVEKEAIEVASETSDDDVAVASDRLQSRLAGRTLADAAPPRPGVDAADTLVREACAALSARAQAAVREPIFVGGTASLAAEQEAFASATSAARLLELLEQHVVVIAVVRELLGPGVTVRIGSENALDDLRECSLVLAPYLVEGERAGSIGVLGPTRMDYRQAQAAVAAVSRQLGRQLSDS